MGRCSICTSNIGEDFRNGKGDIGQQIERFDEKEGRREGGAQFNTFPIDRGFWQLSSLVLLFGFGFRSKLDVGRGEVINLLTIGKSSGAVNVVILVAAEQSTLEEADSSSSNKVLTKFKLRPKLTKLTW